MRREEGIEEMGEDVIDRRPFIETSCSGNVTQEPPLRTGNVWSAVAHIVTGVIGAGVLSLAWSLAQLGWIAGPLCIILLAATTLVSVFLLCDCYRYPHPEHGFLRSSSYMHAVKLYLGEGRQKVCGVLVHVILYGTAVAYVITSATSIRFSFSSNFLSAYTFRAPSFSSYMVNGKICFRIKY